MQSAFSQKTLFAPLAEKINLFLPLVLLLFAILEVIFLWRFTKDQQLWVLLLVNVVFLNITHQCFTFLLLAFHPAFRHWLKLRSKGNLSRLLKRGALLFLLLFFFCFAALSPSWPAYISHLLVALFVFADTVFAYQHSISQSYGLSISYLEHGQVS
jgi:hypothetical protein